MKRGLVLGKFMPLHKGHVALIDFALQHCDELIILISASESEQIPGEIRLNWVKETYKHDDRAKPVLLNYDEVLLPNTSVSSEGVSKLWADYLKIQLPPVDIIFASEAYGAYMGRFLNCGSMIFDEPRKIVPVSATQIREAPFAYWEFLPDAVKPYYTKKVCLYGTESTGKTTFAQKLAAHFNTVFVPEMARDILEHTDQCTEQDLQAIAGLHAQAINEQLKQANKLLFVDSDLNITRSYSRFLFNKKLEVPRWIEEANRSDLYLYLDADAPYVQDGTRLTEAERNKLDESHADELNNQGISFILIQGNNWDTRFDSCVDAVNAFINGGRG
ncbi:MAG TPA: AAA family ATPase [Mucilaginibacter sp.]